MMNTLSLLLAHLLPSLAAALGLALLLGALRRALKPALEEGAQALVGISVAFVSMIFAFILGFTLVNLWGNYAAAESVVQEEANEVRAIYRVAGFMPGGERLHALLKDYAGSIAKDEWPAMRRGEASPESDRLKNEVWRETLSLVSKGRGSAVMSSEVLDCLVRMNHARRKRLSMTESALHPLLLLALAVTGTSTFIGLLLVGVKNRRVQFLVDTLVALCIALNVNLLLSLDRPFSGTGFTVSNDAFSTLADRMNADAP
ncbi:MAG: DUF4239 domain-containing protein [Elusimicrobiota bacterium]|jgi:hypothetical protein